MVKTNLESNAWAPAEAGARTLLRGSFLVLCAFGILTLLLTASVSSKAQVGGEGEPDYHRLFRDVDVRLEQSYLDLDRIQPRPLVEKALSALELSADEIYVENSDPEQPFVALHVKNAVQSYKLHDIKTRQDSIRLLESIFDFLARHYSGETALNDLRYAAMNGYLSGIDPHTSVFTPKSFEEFKVHIDGEIFGVGMLVGNTLDGNLEVRQVLQNTPASRAGFKKGDLIVQIDDESTINMTVMEAVQKIRGPRNTEVVLTVKRSSGKDKEPLETLPIAVKRDRVFILSVESKLLDRPKAEGAGAKGGRVGYAKVNQFDQNTSRSLRENLAKLKSESQGELSALILDFRDNSGGLLTQAVEMCDIFLRSGEIVSTAQKNEPPRAQRATLDGDEPDYPLILLANESSASGAEIVIGALQKNNRAIVLGTRTFGKGSVQQLQRLQHGAQLKITVSEYLIPGNVSIQENGVVPDILAQEVLLREDFFNMFPRERALTERDYEAHIISKYKRDEEPLYAIQYLSSSSSGGARQREEEEEEEDGDAELLLRGSIQPEKDPLVQMALRVLALAEKPFNPHRLLKEKKQSFESLREEFYGQIVARLAELGIDWSAGEESASTGPEPPQVEVAMSYQLIQEPSRIQEDPVPQNKLLVSARATNRGTETLHRLKGISRSDYYAFEEREFLFGRLAPGETVERSQKIRLPYFPHAQNSLLRLEVSGPDSRVIASQALEIELQGKPRPAFAYTASLQDGEGQPVKALGSPSDVTLALTIENVGLGPSYKGKARLRNKTGRQIFLQKGVVEFSDLAPGEATDVEFRFQVRPGDSVETYDFELVIEDSYSSEALLRKLKIPPKGSKAPGFANGMRFAPPRIELSILDPESSQPILVTGRQLVTLSGKVSSEGDSFNAWVTNLPVTPRSRNPDKIFFADSGLKSELAFNTRVRLSDGTNLVTVVSKDRNGLESRQSLMVRKN
jgi:carboxyl-terminal processing protease